MVDIFLPYGNITVLSRYEAEVGFEPTITSL
jgi:hypothetical protein